MRQQKIQHLVVFSLLCNCFEELKTSSEPQFVLLCVFIPAAVICVRFNYHRHVGEQQ